MLPDFPICFAPILGAAQLDIYNGHNIVFIDEKFENYPPVVVEWLYNHERSHVLFNTPDSGRSIQTEMNCDRVAFNQMIQDGWSKSMILGAMDLALMPSDEKTLRIEKLDKLN